MVINMIIVSPYCFLKAHYYTSQLPQNNYFLLPFYYHVSKVVIKVIIFNVSIYYHINGILILINFYYFIVMVYSYGI